MVGRPRRVLLVEDDFTVALKLQEHLSRLGHVCVGPVSTVADAIALARMPALLDAAILNVIVAGESVDALCEVLDKRRIPFGFATAMRASLEGGHWRARPCIERPYAADDVRRLVERLTMGGLAQ